MRDNHYSKTFQCMEFRFQLSRKSKTEASHPTGSWGHVLLQHQSGWWGQVGSSVWVACRAANEPFTITEKAPTSAFTYKTTIIHNVIGHGTHGK